MAITFNMEKVNALKALPEYLEEAKQAGKKGVETTAEVARESGAPVLIKSCDAMLEGTDGLWKQSDDLQEVARKAHGVYHTLGSTMGYEI